ncbi:uncharacterized protein LOC135848696 [Planococcus citri]|uniref:uncharacterized protein LOC135848696 n=1 Tax=Planococcus citri TaxID=170843 RepID=UPI0031F9402D
MQNLNSHRKLSLTGVLNFDFFVMKFVILILVFWNGVLIEGIPNDYKQILQPRSTGEMDKPVVNSVNEQHPDTPELKPEEITNNDDNTTKDKDENTQKDNNDHTIKNIEIVPVEEAGPDETAEPLENYLDRLKEEAKETNKTDPHTMPLLSGLNKIMKETPTKLAKVLINNTWHLFDLGTSGSSRRTRNLQETSYLMAPFYALAAMLQQLTQGMHLTGPGGANAANNAQGGSVFDFLFPLSYLAHMFTGSPDVHKNLLGALGSHGAPNVQNNPSVNYILVIDNRHKQKADHMLEGKTPNETLSKVKEYLKKPELDTEEKFYIAWKLYDLFTESYEHDDKTNLKIIKFIIEIGQDPRFNGLFENLNKKKDDPEFGKIWKLFKNSHQKLNKKYRNILSNLPEGTIIQHPSPNCFVIGPIHHDITSLEKKDDLDSKDEKRKLFTKGLDSSDDYRICCIDDNNEAKANQFLGGESNSEMLPNIEKNLNKEDLDPEHGWYIILKLYNTFKKLDKNDKDKDKIIQLINQTGKDPKFKKLFENIKAKNEPRFQDIWKTFNSEPKDLEESIKLQSPSPPTLDKDTLDKLDPRIYELLKKDPLLSQRLEAAKIPKDEKEDNKKDTEHLKTIEELLRQPSATADSKGKLLMSPEQPKVGETTPPSPPRKLSWFHDPGIEHNARVIKDLADHYASKNNVSYADLEGVEKLLKNPALDTESQNNLITFVQKWYGPNVRDEKMKPKFDELVRLIRQNPEYNKQFETLNPFRQEPPAAKEKDTKDPQNAPVDKIYNLSGAPLESFLKHVADMLKNPLLGFHERMNLIKFLYSWQKFDNVDERIKQKVEETIQSIKEYELNYQIYETLRQAR